MKTMNKYLKVVLCFLAFAVCSFLFAFTPTMSAVFAYTASDYFDAVNQIKSIKMQSKVNPASEVEEEQQFLIPFPTNMTGTKTVIRVIDPAGASHDYTVDGNSDVNDYNFFADHASTSGEVEENFVRVNALNNGSYQVVYITTVGTGSAAKVYYSNTYKVEVENVSYELDFTTDGLLNLYKTEVSVGTDVVVYDAIAKVVDGTGTVAISAGNEEYVKVTKNGAQQILNATDSVFKTKTENSATVYYIDTDETGVYTIEYTFTDSTNRPTKTFTFNVVEADDYKAEKSLTVNAATLPSMELGQQGINLPKLTVNREGEKNVEHNVTKIVIEKENNSNIKLELNANVYTFDFLVSNFSNVEKYEDMVGVYTVTYHVKDAYNNTTTYTTRTNTAISVSTKPSAYLAFDYDVEDATANDTNGFKLAQDEVVETKTAETTLKASYGYSEIILPALYGTDNLTNTEDLMFVRYLRNANTREVYYVDNLRYEDGKLVEVEYGKKGYNYALYNTEDGGVTKTTKTSRPNSAQAFKFSANNDEQEFAGTYYLEYKVISNKVKERTGYVYATGTTEYSIEVLKDPARSQTDATAPKIEITNLKNSSIRPEDGVTVQVSVSDDYDTRLQKAVFYYSEKTSANTLEQDIEDVYNAVVEASGKANINALTGAKYKADFIGRMQAKGYANFGVIEASETANKFVQSSFDKTLSQIVIVAVAVNDNTNNKVDTDTVTLTLKNTTETTPPAAKVIKTTIEASIDDSTNLISTDGNKTFKQGVDVKLPTVYFVDEHDSNLQMSVMYYVATTDSEGNLVKKPETKAGLDYRYPTNVVYSANEIDGGVIKTSETGTYYVVYTAIDDAGNTSVSYFSFVVVDSSKPLLSVDVSSNDEFTQSGNTIMAEVGSTLDFEALLYSGDGNNTDYTNDLKTNITLKVSTDGAGLDFRPSGDAENSYIFNSVGTYTVTVTASYDGRPADPKVLYVQVANPSIAWLEEFDLPKYASKDSTVYLPDVAASHNAVVSVKVTAPGGATPVAGEAKKVTQDGITVWAFTTNENSKGTYKVTYTATSKYGTIEKTFSIKVGDNVAPVFSMKYENELKQDIIYTGSDISYTVEMNKSTKKFIVTAKRGDDTIYSYDLALVISDKDDGGINNQNMSWSNLTYTVTGDNVTGETGNYTITGAGKVTLTLNMKDSYDNVATREISFNVVTESDVEEVNDTVLGTILIVISLVILAGVILFFIFTGNGKGGKKVNNKKELKNKTSEVVSEKVEETVEVKEDDKAAEIKTVEEETENNETDATEESTEDDEAKTGDVE